MKRCVSLFALPLAVTLGPTAAQASNDVAYFMSGDAALVSGAVAASTEDSGAVWYNPAGLGNIRRQQVDLMTTVALVESRRIPAGMVTTLPDGQSRITLDESRLDVPMPSTIYVRRIGGLTLGGGIFISQDEDAHLAGGQTAGGDTSYSMARANVDVVTQRYHLGVATGFEVSRSVRLGFGLFGVYQDEQHVQDLGLAYIDAATGEQVAVQYEWREASERLGVEATAGLQVDATDALALGLVVRSPIWLLSESVDAFELFTLGMVVPNEQGAPQSVVFGGVVPEPRAAAGRGLWEPLRVVGSLAYDFGPVTTLAELSHAPRLRSLEVELEGGPETRYLVDRRAVTNFRFGALVRASKTVEVGWGAYTDRSPQREPEPGTVDVDYVGVTGGVRLTEPVKLARSERADHLLFRTTVAARYGFGQGQATQVNAVVDGSEDIDLTFDRHVDVTFHELHLLIGAGVLF